MDGFSGANAILGTILPIGEVIVRVIKLCREWKDIPEEVQRATAQLESAKIVLKLVEDAESDNVGKQAPADLRRLITIYANDIYNDAERLRQSTGDGKPLSTALAKSKYLFDKPTRVEIQKRLSSSTALLADCIQACLSLQNIHANKATFLGLEAARSDLQQLDPIFNGLIRGHQAIEQRLISNEAIIRDLKSSFQEVHVQMSKIQELEEDVTYPLWYQQQPRALTFDRKNTKTTADNRISPKKYWSLSLHWLQLSRRWDKFGTTWEITSRVPLPILFGYALPFSISIRTQMNWLSIKNVRINSIGLVRTIDCSSELWVSCVRGDLLRVQFLLNEERMDPFCVLDKRISAKNHRGGPDTCCRMFENGDTLLMPAVESGNRDLVRYLLQIGVSANEKNDSHRNVLFLAFRRGKVDIARDLVYRGAALDEPDSHGLTVLDMLVAATRPSLEEPESVSLKPSNTVKENHATDLISLLLAEQFPYFAGVGEQGNHDPPLLTAARKGLMNVYTSLARIAQTLRRSGYSGVDPLELFQCAVSRPSQSILHGIMKNHPSLDITYGGFCGEHVLITVLLKWERFDMNDFEALLQRGVDPNIQDKFGKTPMHYAVQKGAPVPWLRKLLDFGAQLDLQCRLGASPLHEASASADTASVKFLLDKGADVNLKTFSGHTPMHAAVVADFQKSFDATNDLYERVTSTISILLEAGADPLIRSHRRWRNESEAYDLPQDVLEKGNLLPIEVDCEWFTPGELAREQQDMPWMSGVYNSVLSTYMEQTGRRSEIWIDQEGEIFWDADTGSPGSIISNIVQ